MRLMIILIGAATAVTALFYAFKGPSDAEIEAKQSAQCVKWGAKLGNSDYIHCRATLAEKADSDSDPIISGLALGMAAGALGAATARR